MPELAPDDQSALDDAGQAPAGDFPRQPQHAESTEQPDEEDEPQAGSPS